LRILHVIDPSMPGLGATALRLVHDVIARAADHAHEAIVMGTSDDLALARRCGLETRGAIQPPRGLPMSGWRELQRLVNDRNSQPSIDVIHAWGLRSAVVAATACPRSPRVSSLLYGPRTDGRGSWLWMLARQPAMPIMCASERAAQQLQRPRFRADMVQVVPPGIAMDERIFTPRETVRARWGEEHGLPADAMIIGLPVDPPDATDVHVIANAAARLNLSGRPTCLVAHHAGRRRLYSRRFLRQLSLSKVLIIDDLIAEPWLVLRGLDAAVMFASTQSPLPILWAVAAGLPIIAEQGGIMNWRDGETALLIPKGDINSTADRMTRLYNDRSLGARLAANALHDFRSTNQLDRYASALAEAWSAAVRWLPATEASIRSKLMYR